MASHSPWPVGQVTFLFTDVEGSTQLWERRTADMSLAQRRHDLLLHRVIEGHGGLVFKTIGDSFCAAFGDAGDAVAAAVEAQRGLREQVPELRVRMALHTGDPEFRNEDYFGRDLSRVKRLLMAGHGGQVLLTKATVESVQGTLTGEPNLRLLGVHRLRDIPLSEAIYQLQCPDLPSDFPPLNTLDVAFRRGLVRALTLAAPVVAIMAGLLFNSIVQTRLATRAAAGERRAALESRTLLALDQTRRGVQQLEADNGLGLLDLIQARKTAEPLPDLREAIGAVWAGWYQSYAGRLVNAVGHNSPVKDLAYSPDSTRLATAAEDGTAQLWDTRTWEPVGSPLQHARSVHIVRFSPDGRLLATAAGSRARLWNVATGEPRGKSFELRSVCSSIAFSPDGKLLAGGCRDGSVSVWDTSSGQPLGRTIRLNRGSVPIVYGTVQVGFGPLPARSLVIGTPNSISLWKAGTNEPPTWLGRNDSSSNIYPELASGRDGTVRAIAGLGKIWLWDAAERRFRGDRIRNPGAVRSLAISADNRLLATKVHEEPIVQLWETATGLRYGLPLSHPDFVFALAFGPTRSKLLVTGSREGGIRFWDTTTGRLGPDPPPTAISVRRMALGPDGRTLAATAPNGTVQIWAVNSPAPCRRLPAPPGTASIVPLSGDAVFASNSVDGLRLWSAKTGQLRGYFSGPGRLPGYSFSQDGQFFVEYEGRNVSVWQTLTGRRFGQPLHLSEPVLIAALSRHGRVLATTSRSQKMELRHAESQWTRAVPLRSPTSGTLEFSPDERLLATSEGDRIDVWETATGRLYGSPIYLGGKPGLVTFSPDSRLLATTRQSSSTVTIRSAASGHAELRRLEHAAHVNFLAFSPDGRRLCTVTAEDKVSLWDLATGQLSGLAMPYRDQVWALQFSPDGKRLATASRSGACLWDLTTSQLLCRPLLSREPVWQAEFASGGKSLILKTGQAIYLYRLPTASSSSEEMAAQASTSLGLEPTRGGSPAAVPWRTWRDRRRRVRQMALWTRQAEVIERRAEP
jgi:WD40 repeat protein/class 3 adenylate cyclase